MDAVTAKNFNSEVEWRPWSYIGELIRCDQINPKQFEGYSDQNNSYSSMHIRLDSFHQDIFLSRQNCEFFFSTLPTQGGFTNFQNANVHVRPNAGAAVFFSYIDPATNITDNGLTQHSGCPVYEGEKKIITQWVRYGVSKETPHSAFNTCKYRLFDRNRHFCLLRWNFSEG